MCDDYCDGNHEGACRHAESKELALEKYASTPRSNGTYPSDAECDQKESKLTDEELRQYREGFACYSDSVRDAMLPRLLATIDARDATIAALTSDRDEWALTARVNAEDMVRTKCALAAAEQRALDAERQRDEYRAALTDAHRADMSNTAQARAEYAVALEAARAEAGVLREALVKLHPVDEHSCDDETCGFNTGDDGNCEKCDALNRALATDAGKLAGEVLRAARAWERAGEEEYDPTFDALMAAVRALDGKGGAR